MNGYIDLSENASYMLLRTNPSLTTNVKLMYNGEKLSLESFDVTGHLSDKKYKDYSVNKNSTYNIDVYNFYHQQAAELPKGLIYKPYKSTRESNFVNDFSMQYETVYWQGCEAIKSKLYDETIGVFAPLYLKSKLPNYFVIFKTDGPSNVNANIISDSDTQYINNYQLDINELFKKSVIVKSFDLSTKSNIGLYLHNYITQPTFRFNPLYVNMSTSQFNFYGIDYKSGILTNRIENFSNTLNKNDLTMLIHDEYITLGWYRNNLIYPNIINLEFIFNDDELQDYKFARYWGLYCNDIEYLETYLKQYEFVSNDINVVNGKIAGYEYVNNDINSENLNSKLEINSKNNTNGRINLHLL